MKDLFARVESGLQNLIERTLERIAGGGPTATSLALVIARAMGAALRKDQRGRSWAPDKYDLLLHPRDLEALLEETPDLEAFLAKAVKQAARDDGYYLAGEPQFALEGDSKTARTRVHVRASHSQDVPAHTQQMSSLPGEEAEGMAGARLVGSDGRVYPLNIEVVSIGRLKDNDIVISDPHVSRRHAQVRQHEGRHVVFDLGSKAGTRVNGELTKASDLHHGDVIMIAACRLTYELEETPPEAPPEKGKLGASI